MMFDNIYNQTRKFEGGYANHPNDRGGATIFGVSSKYWPNEFATIKALVDQGKSAEAEAFTKNFYKTNFYDAAGVEKAPPELQPMLFDAAVNHGVGTARKMLASSTTPEDFLNNRQKYMDQIVKNDPSQAVFQKGWENRVNQQRAGIRPEAKAYIDNLVKQYTPDEILMVARPQSQDPNLKMADGSPLYTPEELQYIESLKGSLQNAEPTTKINEAQGTEVLKGGYAMMDRKPVTDPAILAQLNAQEPPKRQPVTDPAILAQLNGGFMGGIKQDLSARAEKYGNILNSQEPALGKLYLALGQSAGLANDVTGRAMSALTPDFIGEPLQKAGQYVLNRAGSLPSMGGGSIGETIPQELNNLAQEYPRASEYAKATGNLGLLASATKLGSSKPAVSAATKTAETAKATGKGILNVADEAAKKASQPLKRAGQPLINLYDDVVRPVLPNAADDAALAGRNKARAGAKLLQRLEQDGITLDDIKSSNKTIYQVGGENVERLGEAVSQMPGKGATIAKNFAENTLDNQSSRVLDNVQRFVSNKTNYTTELEKVIESGRAKAAPLYDEAYKNNLSVSSKVLDRVAETPAGRAALSKARVKMQNDRSLMGIPDKELGALNRDLAAIGKMEKSEGGVASGLKLRTWDYVKRSLDDQISDARKAGSADDARILTKLKNDLVSELDKLDSTGSYREARKVSRGYIEDADAFELGQKFSKMPAEDIKKTIADMSESEKSLFRMGISKYLTEKIDNAADNSNIAKLVTGKKGVRERLEAALGKEEYSQLERALDSEKTDFLKAQRLKGGSRTARMGAEMDDLTDNTFDTIQSVGRRGLLGTVAEKGLQFAASKYQLGNQGVSEEIAKALFEPNPVQREALLNSMFEQSLQRGLLKKPVQRGLLKTP